MIDKIKEEIRKDIRMLDGNYTHWENAAENTEVDYNQGYNEGRRDQSRDSQHKLKRLLAFIESIENK